MQILTSSKYVGILPFDIADPSWLKNLSLDQIKVRFYFLRELRIVPNCIEKMRGGVKEPVAGLAEVLLRSRTKITVLIPKTHLPLPKQKAKPFLSDLKQFFLTKCWEFRAGCCIYWSLYILCNHQCCCYFVLCTVSFLWSHSPNSLIFFFFPNLSTL